VLRKLFESKAEEEVGTGGECILRSFIICTVHQILSGWSDEGKWGVSGKFRGSSKFLQLFLYILSISCC